MQLTRASREVSAGFFSSGVEQSWRKRRRKTQMRYEGMRRDLVLIGSSPRGLANRCLRREPIIETEDKAERPDVEKFLIAMEDLSTIAKGTKA
jgi:hypothetical protein